VNWVILTTAPDQLVAEMWREILIGEGISARVRAGDTASFMGVSNYPCRIMVLEDDRERAAEVLESQLGLESLP
jgi:hypothetical protein